MSFLTVCQRAIHSGLASFRNLPRAGALLLALLLAACQTGGEGMDVLESVAVAPKAGKTMGNGPVKLAVLLPGASDAGAVDAASVGEAANLAIADLGPDAITVVFLDGEGTAASQAREAGAVAAIGPARAGAMPITLAAGEARYDIFLDVADSAAAGVVAAAQGNPANVALLVADTDAAGRIEKRVEGAVAKVGGKIVARGRFGTDAASVDAAVARIAAARTAPDIVLITAGGAAPASVLTALRAKQAVPTSARLVGTSGWRAEDMADPAVDGTLIARLDRSELTPMAERFRAAYGRDPTDTAAYAYDLFALSIGIATAFGADGFTQKVFESAKGFRGSTGVFRFRADGGSERLLALYRISGGALRLERAGPASF